MTALLLVEDNELNRDMLSRRLSRKGYVVDMAVDGGEALEVLDPARHAVVLLDMDLPVVDGWEVARRLRADPKTAKTPLIALTAHAMSGDRARALDAGCDEYETKPVDFARLLEKIELIRRRDLDDP